MRCLRRSPLLFYNLMIKCASKLYMPHLSFGVSGRTKPGFLCAIDTLTYIKPTVICSKKGSLRVDSNNSCLHKGSNMPSASTQHPCRFISASLQLPIQIDASSVSSTWSCATPWGTTTKLRFPVVTHLQCASALDVIDDFPGIMHVHAHGVTRREPVQAAVWRFHLPPLTSPRISA